MRRTVLATAAIVAVVGMTSSPSYTQSTSTPFVQEGFEDANFTGRGWYDSPTATLSTAEKYSGTRSFECHLPVGATGCAGGSPRRHSIPASDSTYLAYYVKHSPSWVGSGKPYHPHIFNFLTNLDPTYQGPAYSHLTTYIEVLGGVPQVAIQDGKNIDETRIGVDLTGVTENRGVAGCNGDSDGHGDGECYRFGGTNSVHWNGKKWRTPIEYFDSTPGSPRYKGDWHLVEAYFKLNTIVNGKGINDGIIQYWHDGNLVIDLHDVVLRTGANPTMKFNQFLFIPHIADGSPVDQAFWVDDLVIAATRPATPPAPPGGIAAPAPPTNVRIIP